MNSKEEIDNFFIQQIKQKKNEKLEITEFEEFNPPIKLEEQLSYSTFPVRCYSCGSIKLGRLIKDKEDREISKLKEDYLKSIELYINITGKEPTELEKKLVIRKLTDEILKDGSEKRKFNEIREKYNNKIKQFLQKNNRKPKNRNP